MMRAARQYGIDLSRSYLIGDRWRDIEAGVSAGCKTVWIDSQYTERAPASVPDARVRSLAEGIEWILMQEEESA
jgi:D-glycero-D-manno-heptose 1,7-bisphosphate phosphatase